jgi:hypothetical protein
MINKMHIKGKYSTTSQRRHNPKTRKVGVESMTKNESKNKFLGLVIMIMIDTAGEGGRRKEWSVYGARSSGHAGACVSARRKRSARSGAHSAAALGELEA